MASFRILKWIPIREVVVASLATFLLTFCATEPPGPPARTNSTSSTKSVGALLQERESLVGVWRGATQVTNCFDSQPGRCGAQQKVTMTLLMQRSSVMIGKYKCEYGNQTCLGANTTGEIFDVSLRGSRLLVRVKMPDGTSCLFAGRLKDAVVIGGYWCYAGGSILEQGIWRAQHVY
jgi:hypothetical protein